ncbi:MAG: phage terminase small subunit P27 family [Acidobacteria bacterium]|nr:phage terminase small subunit P27 family [Acidobacteriota bacterium]
MGRRGPPPTPTHLKVLHGNPGKRPINWREPRPRQNVPRCPAWLNKDAKAAWKRMVPTLRDMGVLTVADGEALAAFCQTYARWRQAEEFLDQHGMVYPLRDEKGNVRCMQQFPQVSIARNLLLLMRSFLQEFGMTPASRSRIELPWEPPVQPVRDGVLVTDRLGRPM